MHRHNSGAAINHAKPSRRSLGAVLRDQRDPISSPYPLEREHPGHFTSHPMQRGITQLPPLLGHMPEVHDRASIRRTPSRFTQNLTNLQTHRTSE
jgi:hypothetical protein